MFKVFKSKEVVDSMNKSNRDILEDFNNYQNNSNLIQTNAINTFNMNNNIPNTIDLNQSIIDAQKRIEEHNKSYQDMISNVNKDDNIEENHVNNTKDNLEYKYNEQLKKHNQVDKIKDIINNSTDENNLENDVVNLNNNYSQIQNDINNQQMFQNNFNQVQQQPMMYPNQQPIYNMNMQNPNLYNSAYQGQNIYPNMMYNQPMYGVVQPQPVPQFNRSDIMVYSVPVQNYNQPYQYMPVNQPQQPIENKSLLQANIYESVEPGFKRCPRCGQKLRDDYKQCFVCGTWLN